MNKLIASIALGASLVAAAAPASAQAWDGRYEDRYDRDDRRGDRWDRGGRWDNNEYARQIQPRLQRIGYQIARSEQRGRLTRGEVVRLRAEHQQLWRLAAQFNRTGGGLDQRELVTLERRIDYLQDRIRSERQDDDRRYYR